MALDLIEVEVVSLEAFTFLPRTILVPLLHEGEDFAQSKFIASWMQLLPVNSDPD